MRPIHTFLTAVIVALMLSPAFAALVLAADKLNGGAP